MLKQVQHDEVREIGAVNRNELVAHARISISRGSKSFRAASRLFDPQTRERAWLLYAWCRACDDIADGQDHGGAMSTTDDPQARLAEIETLTDHALRGIGQLPPAFQGLKVVADECRIPRRYMDDLIAGFARDAGGWRPQSEADLMDYCYHVAGSVGCMMAIVMGVDPDDTATLDRACDLGLAFQLANIARDIAEDAAAGRCYLPADWLAEAGIAFDAIMAPENRAALAGLARRLANLAAAYEKSARHGTPALPHRSAWAVLSAAAIYGAIARKVAANPARALEARVFTSRVEKAGFALNAWRQARRRKWIYRAGAREANLWTRPA
ncbi:MAG: phytoene/squalene synthase family protein [Sphingobium sp.]|nr:phytoene/squalene synthase family protein [Sphingobium sp.]